MHFSNDYGYGARRRLRRGAHGGGLVAVHAPRRPRPTSTIGTTPTRPGWSIAAKRHGHGGRVDRADAVHHRRRACRCRDQPHPFRLHQAPHLPRRPLGQPRSSCSTAPAAPTRRPTAASPGSTASMRSAARTPNGTWTVRVENTSGSDTGTLTSVKVTAYGQGGSTDDVYHYTDEFLAMEALAGRRRPRHPHRHQWRHRLDRRRGGHRQRRPQPQRRRVHQGQRRRTGSRSPAAPRSSTPSPATATIRSPATAPPTSSTACAATTPSTAGGGNDQMFGGKGNDTYVVAQSGDVADETGGSGDRHGQVEHHLQPLRREPTPRGRSST